MHASIQTNNATLGFGQERELKTPHTPIQETALPQQSVLRHLREIWPDSCYPYRPAARMENVTCHLWSGGAANGQIAAPTSMAECGSPFVGCAQVRDFGLSAGRTSEQRQSSSSHGTGRGREQWLCHCNYCCDPQGVFFSKYSLHLRKTCSLPYSSMNTCFAHCGMS